MLMALIMILCGEFKGIDYDDEGFLIIGDFKVIEVGDEGFSSSEDFKGIDDDYDANGDLH